MFDPVLVASGFPGVRAVALSAQQSYPYSDRAYCNDAEAILKSLGETTGNCIDAAIDCSDSSCLQRAVNVQTSLSISIYTKLFPRF